MYQKTFIYFGSLHVAARKRCFW